MDDVGPQGLDEDFADRVLLSLAPNQNGRWRIGALVFGPHADIYAVVIASRPDFNAPSLCLTMLGRQRLELAPVNFVDALEVLREVIDVALIEERPVLGIERSTPERIPKVGDIRPSGTSNAGPGTGVKVQFEPSTNSSAIRSPSAPATRSDSVSTGVMSIGSPPSPLGSPATIVSPRSRTAICAASRCSDAPERCRDG